MSNFEVKIERIFVKPHPNADKLDLANIGSLEGWQVVIGKKAIEVDGETVFVSRYATGDLVAYIGENAVVPEWVLKKYGYWNEEQNKGMLAGSKGTRVKAIRLRDEFSMGICIPITTVNVNEIVQHFIDTVDDQNMQSRHIVFEGQDVSDLLGVTKYEAPIPVALAGEICNLTGYTLNFDIENVKRYPDLIQEGEDVIFTEKIHGTWCAMGCVPELNHPELDEGKFVVSSKGFSGQGLAFKFNEKNEGNVYLRMFKTVKEKIQLLSDWVATSNYSENGTVYVLGEVFGPIQDLRYGFNDPQFRVFDIYVGLPSKGRYLAINEVINICEMFGFIHVPVLYRGPFSLEVMKQYTDGKETVSGKEQHMREGIVMNVIPERYSPELHSRLVLKSVSETYLTRKNKNATEFA